MFMQIAKNKTARLRDVIGVFDLDTSTVSGVTKNFLSNSEKKGEVAGINILPKSFVLVQLPPPPVDGTPLKEGGKERIYFSASMTGHIKKSGIM
jgi:hypothetical protein